MEKRAIQTNILVISTVAAALLAVAGLGFSAPAGELSKLVYDGNYWCVSNWIEEEDAQGNHVYLPDPDGRGMMDRRLKGKENWMRLDQVTAETKEEAEQKATRSGLFEPSEKTALREALDKSDAAFFTSHFNTGATHPGPCVGTGMGTGLIGFWINDSIRKDCFDIDPAGASSGDCANRTSVGNSSAFTAEQINSYLKKYSPKSPLNGMGEAFVSAGKKYGVNPGFLLGMTNAESSLGLQCISGSPPAPQGLGGSHNAFGLTKSGQGTFITYGSYQEGIEAAAKNLGSSTYKNLNGTIKEIRLKWCGYEENEGTGIKLSDGSVITYACQNGKSNWEAEVLAVMNKLASDNPCTSAPSTNDSPNVSTTTCGQTVESLIPGVSMYSKGGKLGREQHLPTPGHYIGADSKPTAFAAGGGAGAFAPHTTEQERWYITSQWPYARFTTRGVIGIPGSQAREIRKKIAHSRLVIRSVETGKTMVVSVEEAGPAGSVSARHGINYGGPPEVYHYLGFKTEPYDNNPSSNHGRIEVLGFAKDQKTKLGPCK
jgi:hypothetical protein